MVYVIAYDFLSIFFFRNNFIQHSPHCSSWTGDGKTELQAFAAAKGKPENNKPMPKAITLHPRNTTRSSYPVVENLL